jgi:hypothetical protein
MSPIAPLILFETHQKRRDDGVELIVARARTLLADLIARGDFETALKAVNVCLDAFSPLPGIVGPFQEAAMALRNLSLEVQISPLEELIENCSRHPAPLVAAIRKQGSGHGSSGPVRALWEAFAMAVAATHATDLQERPWMSIRGFAFQLHAQPESANAASILISELLRFGETLPAPPAVLDILRDDLSKLRTKTSPATNHSKRPVPYAKTVVFIILLAVIISAFIAVGHFNPSYSPIRIFARQEVAKEEREVIPPASKGERFTRDFVRYCHFQEERLRVIKQHVRGAEDIQAYNMLANDYNARCSNFYYLDEDLKIVKEEVRAKKQVLEADAQRILSTWPWHAASPNASAAPAK